MPRDYTRLPVNKIRRKDRAVEEDQWIKSLLEKAPFGTFAMVSNGMPIVNSNIFYYDKAVNAIYFHTAGEGRTRSSIEKDAAICFSISEMGRLLPAERALNFSVEYKGVAAFGRVMIVESPSEAKELLQKICDKYFPHLQPDKDYATPSPEELKRTTVYKMTIDHWSGKQKLVEDDFPGAFFYGSKS